jgi:hypothetical protein
MQITDAVIHQLLYNALNIGVYGMIASKRKEVVDNQKKTLTANHHDIVTSGTSQSDDIFGS